MGSEKKLLKKIKKYQERLERCRRRPRSPENENCRSRSRSPLRYDVMEESFPNEEDTNDVIEDALWPTPHEGRAEQGDLVVPLANETHVDSAEDIIEPYREVLGCYEPPKTFEGELQGDICKNWTHILTEGLTRQEKDDILKKHAIPTNCKLLEAPALNVEVKNALTENAKSRDRAIEMQTHQLGIATSIVGQVMSTLIANQAIDNISIFKSLSDATKLLNDLNYQNSKTRRTLIAPVLDKSFITMIEKTKRDENLYGDNLSEKIKTNKLVQQSTTQIKKPIPKPPISINKPRPVSGNRYGPPRQPTPQQAKPMVRGGPKSRAAQPSQQRGGYTRRHERGRSSYNNNRR